MKFPGVLDGDSISIPSNELHMQMSRSLASEAIVRHYAGKKKVCTMRLFFATGNFRLTMLSR